MRRFSTGRVGSLTNPSYTASVSAETLSRNSRRNNGFGLSPQQNSGSRRSIAAPPIGSTAVAGAQVKEPVLLHFRGGAPASCGIFCSFLNYARTDVMYRLFARSEDSKLNDFLAAMSKEQEVKQCPAATASTTFSIPGHTDPWAAHRITSRTTSHIRSHTSSTICRSRSFGKRTN